MIAPRLTGPIWSGPTILLYLSLFLLLLVFFIVLNAHSAERGARVSAALASIGRSFAPIRAAAQAGSTGAPATAEVAAANAGLRRIGDLVESGLAIAKIELVEPGRRLVVNLPAEELFAPDAVGVRADRVGLIDRIATALRDESGPIRYEVDFLTAFGSDPIGGSDRPSAVTRAASVARALMSAGAPAEGVAIGLERGTPGMVRFLFSARPLRGGSGAGAPRAGRGASDAGG